MPRLPTTTSSGPAWPANAGFPGGAAPLQQAYTLYEAGRLDEARLLCQSIVLANPAFAEALNLLGVILAEKGLLTQAIARFTAAVTAAPEMVDAWRNRGVALSDLGDFEAALACFDTVVSRAPDKDQGHFDRGMTLARMGRFADSVAAYDRVLVLDGPHPAAFANRGISQLWAGSPKDAMTSFDRALALDPGHTNAAINKALLSMLLGDYPVGLPLFEHRPRPGVIRTAAPAWLGGADVAGKTLLIHAEQGFGDSIQFCRYVPMLAAMGAKVILAVPEPLIALMTTLDGAAAVVDIADAPPPHDFHCPLPSLPLAFGTTVDTIPAGVPYLSADPARVAVWKQRLAHLPGLRVGLVWAGAARIGDGASIGMDLRRSIPLWAFQPLGGVPGCSFVSAQIGSAAAQVTDPPPGLVPYDETGTIESFADTAAMFANLDLVITVDTAPVHLAGALGRKVWLLNRFDTCWRWLMNREDSPWYPTLRIFRQPEPGAWDPVIARVRDALLSLPASGQASDNH